MEADEINEQLTRKEERAKERAERKLSKLNAAKRQEYDQLKYQCKRFENWRQEVLPFVQEDGRILTQEERIAIWKQQQEEIKQQKKTDK
jgi:hypothetical protein